MSAPHPDDITGPEEAPPFTDLTDERAVDLLRRWTEDAQKDPATHRYFPSVARMFFRVLAHEAERVKERAAWDTERGASDTTQPLGVPGTASVTLAGEEVYDVFHAVLDAVQAWTTDDEVLPNNEAHRRFLRHLDALRIMTSAVIAPTPRSCRPTSPTPGPPRTGDTIAGWRAAGSTERAARRGRRPRWPRSVKEATTRDRAMRRARHLRLVPPVLLIPPTPPPGEPEPEPDSGPAL